MSRSTTRRLSASETPPCVALRSGCRTREVLAPWTAQVADLGAILTASRADVIELLQPGFAERAAELGLEDASLGYDAELPTISALEARLDRDIERGTTGVGPHLDEIAVRSGARDLRTFGSQGEQRLAVLALLLAEAELISARRRVPPLLLLDDALSELDDRRRRILSERIGAAGQTIVTATGAEALPLAPAQLLRVTPGRVEARLMDRLDASVRGALRGAGVPDAGALADVVRVWPQAVGDAIARAAWPKRIARDGTLHVAAISATWAFELTLLADEILAKLTDAVSAGAPTAISFSPGPVPSPPAPLAGEKPPSPPEIDAETRLLADAADGCDDGRRAPGDDRESRRSEPRESRRRPPFLIHCVDPKKA